MMVARLCNFDIPSMLNRLVENLKTLPKTVGC